jgi:transcriptional regulator with XRE-family HTH domain
VTAPRDLPRDIGGFIRDLRRNAQISLRQLAEQAGVSNPYLSQIERGLRKPSAEVLAQLAHALRVSTPMMYLRAGLLDSRDGQGVLAAIAADPDLNVAQKQSLTQIYETFRRENARNEGESPDEAPSPTAEPTAGPTGAVDPIGAVDPTAGPTGAADPTADPTADRTAPARKPRKAAKRPARTTSPKPSAEAVTAVPGAEENTEERS